MRQTFLSRSTEETQALAKAIAQKIPRGTLICLYGPLGSGKTVFVRGLAKGLKTRGHVQSPTFPLLREYRCSKGTLYHMDLFRIRPRDFSALGFEEFFNPVNGWTAIEWADKVRRRLPPERLDIRLKILSPSCREITTA